MWIHILIFICYGILFLRARGFFSRSGAYLTGKLPSFFKLNRKQLSVFLITVFCGNMIGTVLTGVWLAENGDGLQFLKREKDTYSEELYVTDGSYREKLDVEVGTEPYTEEEKHNLLKQTADHLGENILGENQSLERVEYPLHLMTEIPGTAIQVQWSTDQPLMLDWEGQIGEEVPEEGVWVHLEAELFLDEVSRIYETEVYVYPEKRTEEEQFIKNVREQIAEQNKKKGEYLYLPEEVNGKTLSWTKANGQQGLFLTGMAVVIGILLILCEKSRKKQELEKRKREMQNDYPLILNKMILLMQAGMSSRRAIRKIALDYQSDRKEGKEKRDGYEELFRIYQEMEQGIPEEETYRRLANRCDLLCYRTLSTLLIQNLKKGSSYFILGLRQECTTAFAERKSRAQILGEEAGTKLLLPMGCMLLIVLVIILVPSMMALG